MNQKILLVLIAAVLAISGCGGSDPTTETPSVNAESGPKEGGDHAEPSHVALTPEQIKAAGIVVAEAGPATIRETLPVYGVIAPNAERVRDVGARFPGVIRTVSAKIGDPVRAGERRPRLHGDVPVVCRGLPIVEQEIRDEGREPGLLDQLRRTRKDG